MLTTHLLMGPCGVQAAYSHRPGADARDRIDTLFFAVTFSRRACLRWPSHGFRLMAARAGLHCTPTVGADCAWCTANTMRAKLSTNSAALAIAEATRCAPGCMSHPIRKMWGHHRPRRVRFWCPPENEAKTRELADCHTGRRMMRHAHHASTDGSVWCPSRIQPSARC